MASSKDSDRLWLSVLKTDTCWIWYGPVNNSGYGSICIKGKWVMVHRFAWEIVHGLVPEHQIHHLCHNRVCVNPAHLEHVTTYEHGKLSKRAQLTHCKRGHEFSYDNTQIKPNGTRSCRACQAITHKLQRDRGER